MPSFKHKISITGNYTDIEQRNADLMLRMSNFLKEGHVIEEVELEPDGVTVTWSKMDFEAVCETLRWKLISADRYDNWSISYGDSNESKYFFDTVGPFIEKIYGVKISKLSLETLMFNKSEDFIELIFQPFKIVRLSFSLIEQGLAGCDEFKRQQRIREVENGIQQLTQRIALDNMTLQQLNTELERLLAGHVPGSK
jgi:hypothetical protein